MNLRRRTRRRERSMRAAHHPRRFAHRGPFAGIPGPIVVVSADDWKGPLWSNRQHVAARLADRQPVIFVQTSQFFGRRFLKALASRGDADRPPAYEGAPPLIFTCWNVAPFRQLVRPLWYANGRLNGLRLRWFLRRHRFGRPALIWNFDPAATPLIDRLTPPVRLYHCVDDYAAYAASRRRAEHLRRGERATLAWADLVFTTSRPLAERLSESHPRVIAMTNVADIGHFSRPRLTEPGPLKGLPAPRLIFAGSFTHRKLDLDFLDALAQDGTGSLVLIGPVTNTEPEFDRRFRFLVARAGVHYLGEVSYAALPAYLQHCDVGLIPYVANDYTLGVFPMKVYEFLAAGIPVVATGVPSAQDVVGLHLVRDAREAQRVLAGLTGKRPRSEALRTQLHGASWEARADEIERVVTDFLRHA